MSRRHGTFVAAAAIFGLRGATPRSILGEGRARADHHVGRVVMMEGLAIRRLDAQRVRDRQMVEQGSRRCANGGGELRFVLRRKRRNEADLHFVTSRNASGVPVRSAMHTLALDGIPLAPVKS